jgi:hypothetical protein
MSAGSYFDRLPEDFMEGQVNRHVLLNGLLSVVIAKSGGVSPVVRDNVPPSQLLGRAPFRVESPFGANALKEGEQLEAEEDLRIEGRPIGAYRSATHCRTK